MNENQVAGYALPDVVKDIAALTQVLTHPERCAYPPGNVKAITGKEATRQGILDGLEWLQERVRAAGNATAVVYFSGHGWRDDEARPPEFYLIPCDVREGKIRSSALRAGDFAEAVGELKPQRLVVLLDCCHAGGMGAKDVSEGYVGAAVPPSLLMGEEKSTGGKGIEELAQGAGRAVLSSSKGEQRSYMRRDGKMSIFTYHLVEALTGHAQPQEGATEVLVSDVMGHVSRHVPKSAGELGKKQEPDYQVSGGNFPVALLLGGKGISKEQPAPDPLGEITEGGRRIHTGGGAYVEGSVHVGGDFVGRDKIIHGDEVHGDKIGGHKVNVGSGSGPVNVGNTTVQGPVSGTGITIGAGARAPASVRV